MFNVVPDVIASTGNVVTLPSDRFLPFPTWYADTPIPYHFVPPEEPLLSARERVAHADAQVFGRTAQAFALQAIHVEGIVSVIADSASHVVYAMARDLDMQRDLRLHAMFLDAEGADGVSADLVVLVEGEDDRPQGVSLV